MHTPKFKPFTFNWKASTKGVPDSSAPHTPARSDTGVSPTGAHVSHGSSTGPFSSGSASLSTSSEASMTSSSSSPTYFYYRAYAEDGAVPIVKPVYSEDPYIRRIPTQLVAQPPMEDDNMSVPMRLITAIAATVVISSLLPPVMAQAPVNDVISWPPGLLLLATVLYAALGAAPDTLWNIEPAVGILMGSGLPFFAIPTMQRVSFVANACHFAPRIRTSNGVSNFWIRSDQVSSVARADAMNAALDVMSPVAYEPAWGEYQFDESRWKLTDAGLLQSIDAEPPKHPDMIKEPSARDFLYFAAVHYHAFWEWDVQIMMQDKLSFSTCDSAGGAIFDVDSEDSALPIVAAQMVRRPHSQSVLRGRAEHQVGSDSYVLDIQHINRDEAICAIDFHSYAPDSAKVIASLNDLAKAYYRVVQYLKRKAVDAPIPTGTAAHVLVGETLWLAILGGVLLDHGRLTIQNLPGRWVIRDASADEAYIERVKAVLSEVEPYARSRKFANIVECGGNSRLAAYPFFLIGLIGQITVRPTG